MTRKPNGYEACLLVAILTALFPVSVKAIGETCTVSATGVAFGNYSYINAVPLDASGNVRVVCTGLLGLLVNYTISLNTGGGSYAARQMSSGANQLQYNLYTDASHNVVWGDGSGGTARVSHSVTLALLGFTTDDPIYGRVPAGQNVPAGGYVDTITVTVNY